MSIWGTILGGAAGFALGGPIGALLGGMAGRAYDQAKDPALQGNTRQIGFTIGVVVLGAKMAKADGTVTRDEVEAFKQVFQVPDNELANVGRVFNMARKDATGFEPYARQIAGLFAGNPRVLEDLLDGLFHIAKADGLMHPAEIDFLSRVAAIFGFSEADFSRIKAAHMGPDARDPYTILGVDPGIADADLKKAYKKLVRENHPDTLIAQGLPKEFVEVANGKLAIINDAYDQLEKQRGMK